MVAENPREGVAFRKAHAEKFKTGKAPLSRARYATMRGRGAQRPSCGYAGYQVWTATISTGPGSSLMSARRKTI